jgi:exonuclease SbcC
MKILSLSFANINSLAGEWRVDFTDPAFTDGLFALTGPTGSGKTSVLDAVSLSLFGRTVRQDSISKETNEVMTRGAGMAYAETAFEAGGRQYLAHWEQRRAREKPSGALQQAKRSLASLPDGATIHDTLRGMDEAVQCAIGLSFEQFTRSVLLAQGQFDAFLKADDKDRSDILEQATGTEIYSRLGAKIFERWQQERDKTRELERDRQAVQILSAEARDALETDFADKTAQKQTLDAAIQILEAQHAWLLRLDAVRKQRDALQTEQAQLDADALAARPDLERLTRAEAARAFDVEYSELKHLREKTKTARIEAAQREQKQADLAADLTALTPRIAEARNAATATQTALDAALPVLAQTRALLGELKAKEAELTAARKAEAAARKTLDGTRQAMAAVEKEIAANRATRETAAAELRKLETDRDTAKAALAPLADTLAAANAVKETAEHERDTRKPDLALALDRANEALLLAQKVASLEQERHKLEDGKPCPLCGATAHPYASGNTPSVTDERKHVKDITAQIAALDHAAEASRKAAETADRAHRKQEQDIQNLQTSVTAKAGELAILVTRIEEAAKRRDQLTLQKQANETDLAARTRERAASETDAQALRDRRAAFFQGDPDTEEKRLRDALEAASAERQDREAQRNTLAANLENARCELATALSRRDASVEAEQNAATALSEKWVAAGFADEPAWLAARQTDDFVAKTKKRRHDLAGQTDNLQGRIQQNANDLLAEETNALTDRPQEEIDADLAARQTAQAECLTALGDLNRQIQTDEENRRRKAEQGDALERQKIIAQKWDNLNKWAGGANGEQFKRYAQGITLRRLLTLANPHVARMTRDRYELVWDAASRALLPDIVDRDQGDARRAVSNLSGGETFIVSLALALGLSAMSSDRFRVDTLFLDEGFGTLDDDALSTALDTLTGLRQDGKLIGVISHVQAVKDQIPAQIRITPQSGGRSALSGPGVAQEGAHSRTHALMN